MGLRSSEAIVVGGHNLGDADRIVIFYTRSYGKVRAVAAGARRIRSRFGGSLELFTHGRLVYFERPNNDLHRLNEFALREPFHSLRSSLDLLTAASEVVELAGVAGVEGEGCEEFFALTLETLQGLNSGIEPSLLLRAFEIRLLKVLGYLPELDRCVRCRGALPEGVQHFGLADGGLLCPTCRAEALETMPASPAALGFLRRVLKGESGFSRLSLDPRMTEELRSLLQTFLELKLGRMIRSARFLSRITGFSLDTLSSH
ncbi:MAG: DNA repair protein RecO [Candidatus Methylomirabilales bacterium]